MWTELVEVVSRNDICSCGDGDGWEVGVFATPYHYFFEGGIFVIGGYLGEFGVKFFEEEGWGCTLLDAMNQAILWVFAANRIKFHCRYSYEERGREVGGDEAIFISLKVEKYLVLEHVI